MIIESIELKNYRNYKELHMEFNQGTNILYGDNAQGKTNILEDVYKRQSPSFSAHTHWWRESHLPPPRPETNPAFHLRKPSL